MVQLPAGLKVPRSPSSPAGETFAWSIHQPPRCHGHRAKDTMTDLSPEPRTGTQHDIAAGDYRATITELGAGLRQLSYRDQPVISGYAADEVPPAGAGQLLIPWPNRVDHGRYPFGGSAYQLDLSEPAHGNAIHGLTRFANWTHGAAREPTGWSSGTYCSASPATRSAWSSRPATGCQPAAWRSR